MEEPAHIQSLCMSYRQTAWPASARQWLKARAFEKARGLNATSCVVFWAPNQSKTPRIRIRRSHESNLLAFSRFSYNFLSFHLGFLPKEINSKFKPDPIQGYRWPIFKLTLSLMSILWNVMIKYHILRIFFFHVSRIFFNIRNFFFNFRIFRFAWEI